MVPMTEQTFARGLWLSLLPLFVRLTWITGFDVSGLYFTPLRVVAPASGTWR
ncbi:hypothetical protein SAMN05192544_11373 [Paraburkholderia hospita]|nr:hypothetical protein SAMN05192544_11373 [Paraburkholderia hospita]